MTTTRQLYSSPMSSNARRTLVCAAHLGVELEIIPVNLADQAARAKVAALNPNGKIPVLVEYSASPSGDAASPGQARLGGGDFVLWESNAINQYLCERTPGQTLLPDAPKARADVNRWLSWQAAHLSPAVGGFNYERMVKKIMGRGEPDPAAIAMHTAEFQRFATVIDKHLATHRWLANDALSLADFSLAATLLHSERAEYPMQPYEHLRAHVARIRETPAWRTTEG
ncbi:MAG TPA: glutathione S-transferase family protein [Kofleriaceae bacterium]|nr:glutathione S-transferase family protein [Kofleriaceae bacterium]